jgi:streptogrisin C
MDAQPQTPVVHRLVLGVVMAAACVFAATSARATEPGGETPTSVEPDPLELAVDELDASAAAKWPDEYAGLWLDGEEVNLAFTSGADAKVADLAMTFPKPELLRAVDAEVSLAQLQSLQDEIVAARDGKTEVAEELAAVAPAEYPVGIDLANNSVYVQVEKITTQVQEAFRSEYEGPVSFDEAPLPVLEACENRADCKPDLRSGLRTEPPGGIPCSTAFTILKNGNRQVLSAAHCGPTHNDTGGRFHSGDRYGEVRGEQFGASVDAERHSVEGAFTAKAWIFVEPEEKSRTVNLVGDYPDLDVGEPVCISGIMSGKSCGEVTDTHYDPGSDDFAGGDRFIRATYCATGGDSGAGAYHGSKALGVHAGGTSASCPTPSDYGIFSHIDLVEQRLDVNVVAN